MDLSVHSDSDKSALAQILEDLLVFALAVPYEWGQDHDPASLRQRIDGVDYLLDGLTLNLAATTRAVRVADAGEQESQVVVYLGDGTHSGARVVARSLLVDRNRRTQSLDLVHIGLLHLAEELPRVCGEGFDVPPLPFSIDGIERERTLSGAGHPGDDHQLAAGNHDIYVLEVVLTRTPHDYRISHCRSDCSTAQKTATKRLLLRGTKRKTAGDFNWCPAVEGHCKCDLDDAAEVHQDRGKHQGDNGHEFQHDVQ